MWWGGIPEWFHQSGTNETKSNQRHPQMTWKLWLQNLARLLSRFMIPITVSLYYSCCSVPIRRCLQKEGWHPLCMPFLVLLDKFVTHLSRPFSHAKSYNVDDYFGLANSGFEQCALTTSCNRIKQTKLRKKYIRVYL